MASTLTDLTSTITSALSSLPPQEKIQDGERMQLLEAINRLQAELEPPVVSLRRFCFSHYPLVIIRVAQGMGIFDAFVEAHGAALTTQELSSKTKGDDKLLSMRWAFLSTNGITLIADIDRTCHALPLRPRYLQGNCQRNISAVASRYGLRDRICAGKHDQALSRLYASKRKNLRVLRTKGLYKSRGCFRCSLSACVQYNTKDHYFEWLKKNPEIQEAFNSVMTESQKHRGDDWFDIFPVTEKLTLSALESSDRALLVDIGAGVGHDIKAFKNRFPELPGKLIFQDLPQVIDTVKEPNSDGIIAVGHDMFESQPIQGAKAYYMRTVLHDFPDKQALEALSHIREAMAKDSILLIHEHTTPEGGNVPPLAATLDFHMMEIFSALERSEQQWVTLLEKAGFRIANVWKGQSATVPVALFEATLP